MIIRFQVQGFTSFGTSFLIILFCEPISQHFFLSAIFDGDVLVMLFFFMLFFVVVVVVVMAVVAIVVVDVVFFFICCGCCGCCFIATAATVCLSFSFIYLFISL